MRVPQSRRWLFLPATLVGCLAVLAAEAALARRGDGSPEAPGSPDVVVGEGPGPGLTLVVLGDSTGSGVGAVTQDLGYPRRVARRLADRLGRRVDLRVLAVSGATVGDVLHEQLPRLAGVLPGLVLVVIGGNDVTHLTPPRRARAQLGEVLDRVAGLGAPVVVAGVPAMGTARRIKQPLRWVIGTLAERVYEPIWRQETSRRGMHRVELAALTGPVFARDPTMLADDGFHPSPAGYEVWAAAISPVLEQAAATIGTVGAPG